MNSKKKSTIIIMSDGTGETATQVAKAALLQFGVQENVQIVRCKNVRTPEQVESIIDEARELEALLLYTVVSQKLREFIRLISEENRIPHLDLFGPILKVLTAYFERKPISKPGLLHEVNEGYFKKIDAVEFTVKHDDGKHLEDLNDADIILIGVSRTSKTPLSMYLAHKGWKVANVPLVLGIEPPKELYKANQDKIVALTIDPNALVGIRKERMKRLGHGLSSRDYSDLTHIGEEMEYSRQLFSQHPRWPVFEVTGKAIEELSTEIIRIISSR